MLSLQGAHDDVAARDVCANMAGADLLVGIYMDAGGSPQNAGSVTTYDTDRPFSAESLAFATLLQDDVLVGHERPGLGDPRRRSGLRCRPKVPGGRPRRREAWPPRPPTTTICCSSGRPTPGYFTTPSRMPGAVIEPLFLTDPFEGSHRRQCADQTVIAQGIAAAVEQYFAPAPKSSTTSTTG